MIVIKRNQDAAQYIAGRREFTNRQGSLSGRPDTSEGRYLPRGWMSRAEYDRMVADRPSYLVFSYATPIGWYGANGWQVTTDRHSMATSTKHMPVLREGIRMAAEIDAALMVLDAEVNETPDRPAPFAWVS